MTERKNINTGLFRLVLAAILSALIAAMTFVPYTGYINYGLFIEITTLHIVVIIGASFLGWKYGAILGAVWGLTNLARAFTNPLWVLFTNPLISVLPRILVGAAGGLITSALLKIRVKKPGVKYLLIGAAAVLTTVLHTALVLTAIYAFGDMLKSAAGFLDLFKSIFGYVVGVNGGLEAVAAAIIVPTVYRALEKLAERRGL